MGRGKDQELLDAARNGDIKTVGKLLELITKRHGPLSSFRRSPSLNCQDVNGYTALHHACLNGHSNIVRLLLAHDVQQDLPDIRGSTSLYLASWAGHQDIAKMLLMNGSKGSNPNAQTIENETPLHSAAQHGHNTVVAILLAYGADPSIRNNSFQTALDLASQFGRLQVVQLLLRAHPNLIAPYRSCDDAFTHQGYSPPYATTPTKHIFTHTCLHLASRNGHKKVVETLLNAGVDVNILTHAGTALHEAALCGKKSVVTTLLKAGVDVHATDGNGRTALNIMKDYPPHVTYDIVTVIKEFMNAGNVHFQPIQAINGVAGTVIEGTQSLPRRLYEKKVQKPKNAKLEFVPKPRNNDNHLTQQHQHQNGQLSNSLSSLDKIVSTPENYLKMKPIMWQKSDNNIDIEEQFQTYKPVYKQAYAGAFMQAKKPTVLGGGTIPSRSIEYISFIKSESNSDEQNTTKSNDEIRPMAYRCVDEYVEMSEPEPSPTPQPRRRLLETADYANLPKLQTDSATREKRQDSNSDIDNNNNNKQIIFRSKTHSPTPDYPPPTVRQAEHTIYEYMQPLTSQANNRHLVGGTHENESSMEHQELSPRSSSAASDCVEHFVGDVPFAGLFKGSTLNLAQDETDGFTATARESLRSPSLVRSIPAARRSLSKQRYSTAGEDFSASRVWAEIDTIFETIGNEVLTAEQADSNGVEEIKTADDTMEENLLRHDEVQTATLRKDNGRNLITPPENSNVINNELRQSLHIRNPDELLLDSPGTPNGSGVNWCHSSYALIFGEIRYTVFYLGSTVIRCLQGTTSTRKSIQKLKITENKDANLLEECNTSTKYLKASKSITRSQLGIAVSHAGVKFIDQKDDTFCMHDIENINCVCQDTDDLRYFAYITKEQELHYCHVFMVDNLELAKEIILTLGQAFEVAYQLALSRQCTPVAEETARCFQKENDEAIDSI